MALNNLKKKALNNLTKRALNNLTKRALNNLKKRARNNNLFERVFEQMASLVGVATYKAPGYTQRIGLPIT
jgi:type IV secretory pathway VirB4 component